MQPVHAEALEGLPFSISIPSHGIIIVSAGKSHGAAALHGMLIPSSSLSWVGAWEGGMDDQMHVND
jgi:hypothetical protein